ncbi:MAG: type II secretion system GspH family protein [Myxococcaceae bacterium]|nr:type II secretion system GspH family protein [Myxococcaceae bacterium]
MKQRAVRGMTLMELMVASGISVVLLAGAVVAGTSLQKRSVQEREVNDTQALSRAVRDQLEVDLSSIGTALGPSRVHVGNNDAGMPMFIYAINVQTNATPPPPPVTDGGTVFIGPSDRLNIFGGLAQGFSFPDGGASPSLLILGDCSGSTNSGTFLTGGTTVCTLAQIPSGAQAALMNKRVLITSPQLGMGCLGTVTGFPTGKQISLSWGYSGQAFGNEPCNPGNSSHPFWNISSNPAPLLMPLVSTSYQISWRTDAGSAPLPVLQYDSDGPLMPDSGWVDLSYDVEQMKVRLGLTDTSDSGVGLVYVGDFGGGADGGTPPQPPIDMMTTSQQQNLLNQLGGFQSRDDAGSGMPDLLQWALMRRVRAIEVTLMLRSRRADKDQAQYVITTGNPVVDAQGHPMDGRKRRVITFNVSPRSFSYGGAP